MIKRGNKIFGKLLLGMTTIQVVLPVIIFFSVLMVKALQWGEVESYQGNEACFKTIKISDATATMDYKAGEEFIYNEVLYDIHTVSHENGCYAIIALADNTETKLQQLNGNTLDAFGKEVVKAIPFCFLYYESFLTWIPVQTPTGNTFGAFCGPYIPDHGMNIITPPPRCAA